MKRRVINGKNDFYTWCDTNNRKDLLDEWDSETNGFLPDEIAYGSHEIVSWRCKKCHSSFMSNIPNRRFGNNCPFCSNQKIKRGMNDFETMCKKEQKEYLLKEWDYEKNSIKPYEISHGSSKKIWWNCKDCGNSYDTTISHRLEGKSCPYCKIDGRKRALAGFNDFEIYCKNNNCEALLDEWDYEKNNYNPSEITYGSTKLIWWKCPRCNNSYRMLVSKRRIGRGCPKCASYVRTSFREQAIFFYVSKIFSDAINQYTYENIELDIYIPSKNIAIEYDGQVWHQNVERDNRKRKLSNSYGIRIINIREPQCPELENVEDTYFYKLSSMSDNEFEKTLNMVFSEIFSTTVDINIERDRFDILGLYANTKLKKSFAYKCPQLVNEWDFEKNGYISPDKMSANSNLKVWWKCSKCNNSYEKRIIDRNKGQGCPYCVNKKVKVGFNDFATTHPQLALEWHPTKNGKLKPTDITHGYDHKVWWIGECGHSWQALIYNRTKGIGCAVCAKRQGRVIIKVETGERFSSLKKAAISCGKTEGSNISACLKGKIKTAYGFHWQEEFVDEE